MNKKRIAALALTLALCCVIWVFVGAQASDLPFTNLFREGFQGYTSNEGQFLAHNMVSSQPLSVSAGQKVWFGPCREGQYFHLVAQDASGNPVSDKVRGKDLTVVDTFGNGTVIYSYTVPAGAGKLVFSVPGNLKNTYVVTTTEISALSWIAYWDLQGVETEDYVGINSYYDVTEGTKLYIGAITEADIISSVVYDKSANPCGNISKADLRLVESFGGEYGIYCYTVPAGVAYTKINYNPEYQQYYSNLKVEPGETVSDEAVVSAFITEWGVPLPLEATVSALKGKSALFLGDSITYGARDRAKIYQWGGWAGRIDYHVGMDVTNNGVSGACITTARQESHSAAHYIYNNLVSEKDEKFDYIIMHGLFNDASIPVKVGTAQGQKDFDPEKANVTEFAGALENLFYTAKTQHPESILGYIVNFHTDRAVDQGPYVEMAIEICKDWGIPYLDLYNRAGFSVAFDDGLHPSSAGYDSMYCIVANWMTTLTPSGATGGLVTTDSSAKVMSYNVFWDLNKEGITGRTDAVLNILEDADADIMMLQEVSSQWVPLLKTYASKHGYSYYGYAHLDNNSMDGVDSNDELTPIFWKNSLYSLEDSGHFYTDEFGTSGEYPRCINWVVLKDKGTDGKLLVMNYHADPNSEAARNLTAQVIVDQIQKIREKHGNIAAVLGGDMNMAKGSTAYNTVVTNGMGDSRYHATTTTGTGTYNAWDRTDPAKFAMGDYIFIADGMSASVFQVITDDWANEEKTMHASDHSPVIAQIGY